MAIRVKNLFLLELALLSIATKIIKAFSGNSAIGTSASWPEIQQRNDGIDYVLMVRISSAMYDILRPQCFEGHDLTMVDHKSRWFCNVCGINSSSMVSFFFNYFFL